MARSHRVLAAIAGAGALAAVAPAGVSASRVHVGPRSVVVATRLGSIVVDRAPFALRIRDAAGRTVLRSVRGVRDAGGVPYAALGAGRGGPDPELRFPVLPGDPDPNPSGGLPVARRAAGRVLSAVRAGGDVDLRLATGDATRPVSLRIGPGPRGTIAVRVTGAPGDRTASVAFKSPAGEAFHGFGGRRESTDLRGRSFTNWVLDYRFPDVSPAYYAAQPQFVSSRGYGVLLDDTPNARWRLAADGLPAWRLSVRSRRLRLLVAPGRPAAVIRTLTALTGRHRLPPGWATGPALSRAVRVGTDSIAVYEAKVTDDVDRIVTGRLPVTQYLFEGWARLPRPFVTEQIRRLRRAGVHTLLYLRPFFADDTAATEPLGRKAQAEAGGYVARTATGGPYRFPDPFPGAEAVLLDPTNPRAATWWKGIVTGLLATGADGFMNDFGEQVQPGMHFADGSRGATMHNRYPVLLQRITRQATDAYERAHGRRVGSTVFFTRAGYSARPGSAAYESAAFPGDETNDWDRATGLPSIVPDMLNRAVGGAPGFTTDIGGYASFHFAGGAWVSTSPELFVRWSQAAAFTPFFRVHNNGLAGQRMPWSYDRVTEERWTAAARLHVRAEPLIRRLWTTFLRTGIPMTRPLWLADPGLRAGGHGDDEWLLGPDLLVAPVLTEGSVSRDVVLPRGCWRLHGTGSRLPGRRTVTVAAPIGSLPWLSRCGARPLR